MTAQRGACNDHFTPTPPLASHPSHSPHFPLHIYLHLPVHTSPLPFRSAPATPCSHSRRRSPTVRPSPPLRQPTPPGARRPILPTGWCAPPCMPCCVWYYHSSIGVLQCHSCIEQCSALHVVYGPTHCIFFYKSNIGVYHIGVRHIVVCGCRIAIWWYCSVNWCHVGEFHFL